MAELRASVEAVLPKDRPVAVFAWWGGTTALGPVRLERDDLTILHPWADLWKDTPMLARHLRAEGIEAYILCEGLLPRTQAGFFRGLTTEPVSEKPCLLRLLAP
jgi:hypothetical protein